MFGKAFEVIDIDRRDDCATCKIADGDDERVDRERELGACSRRAEQLTRSNSDPHVDGANFDPVATKACEYDRIGAPAADDLREHGCYSRDGTIPASHLGHEGTYSISSLRGAMRQCRQRLAIEK